MASDAQHAENVKQSLKTRLPHLRRLQKGGKVWGLGRHKKWQTCSTVCEISLYTFCYVCKSHARQTGPGGPKCETLVENAPPRVSQEAAKKARWGSRGAKNVKHSSKTWFRKNFQEILEKPTGRKCETLSENGYNNNSPGFAGPSFYHGNIAVLKKIMSEV